MNINKIGWNDSLLSLYGKKKPPQSALKLQDAQIKSLYDLLWLLPLRIQKAPKLQSFEHINLSEIFMGRGKLINIRFSPAYGKRGKRGLQLFNATAVIKDLLSENFMTLKWFNTYPSLKKQLESLEEFSFLGTVSEYKGSLQIANPKINPASFSETSMLIEYPTVNTVSGKNIQKVIQKIPQYLWEQEVPAFSNQFQNIDLNLKFKMLHGLVESEKEERIEAKNQLIYEEFFYNQLKVYARKLKNKKLTSMPFIISEEKKKSLKSFFPYPLTPDQATVFNEILHDFSLNYPMMRIIQGDVGCGKTTVAILAALAILSQKKQTAFMCPTETLATQHYETLKNVLPNEITTALLTGSTQNKQEVYNQLETGEIQIVIGTHALIQPSVKFHQLGLAVIDEQHKFGVHQRQTLTSKGKGVHTLLMSATPIPRTLQLVQYGDLDISTIKSMPANRKGVKTRIVKPDTYSKYLSFIKTRMSLGEQIYIVAPAIEENETIRLKNVYSILDLYQKYFPEYKIDVLHGQLKPDEKKEVMQEFEKGKINLLISTTVIEVGINVINSSVIAIYHPERFGLSSLHQLRGRVGRGEKPGFCFLITDKDTPSDALNKIKIIEKSNDGFEIAEADLMNRGQGDLFGISQSGHLSHYKVADILKDISIFKQVTKDIEKLQMNKTEQLNQFLLRLLEDTQVSSTI